MRGSCSKSFQKVFQVNLDGHHPLPFGILSQTLLKGQFSPFPAFPINKICFQLKLYMSTNINLHQLSIYNLIYSIIAPKHESYNPLYVIDDDYLLFSCSKQKRKENQNLYSELLLLEITFQTREKGRRFQFPNSYKYYLVTFRIQPVRQKSCNCSSKMR